MNTDHTLEVPKFEGDITNRCAVAMDSQGTVMLMNPGASIAMSKEQALVHAAWLVAIVDRSENFEEFRAILKAVLET
jgi:hypothetical protein